MIEAIFLAALAVAQPVTVESQQPMQAYFPPSLTTPVPHCVHGKEIGSDAAIEAFEVGWYSRELQAAGEASFYALSRDPKRASGQTIRFTWLRSFHPLVVIRIEGLGSGVPRLFVTQLSGAGGNSPETVDKQSTRTLSSAEAGKLVALLGAVTFLRPPKMEQPPKRCTVKLDGMDGARWLIEVVDKDGYHFAEAWSPKEGGLHALATAMISLTGWGFGDVY